MWGATAEGFRGLQGCNRAGFRVQGFRELQGAIGQGLGRKGLGSCRVQWGKVWGAIGNRFRGLQGATAQRLGCSKWRVWGAAECKGSEFECNSRRAWGGCGVQRRRFWGEQKGSGGCRLQWGVVWGAMGKGSRGAARCNTGKAGVCRGRVREVQEGRGAGRRVQGGGRRDPAAPTGPARMR